MSEFSWRPSRAIEFFRPLFKVIESAAEAGIFVGTEAAKFQKETGLLGQKGAFGGGPYTPEGIKQEYDMFTFTPSTRQF